MKYRLVKFADRGLKPIYLLHLITPDKTSLPPGVTLLYDESASVHGYSFSGSASTISFPAGVVFTRCSYFPEEFSILLTFKVGAKSANRNECLFSLMPRGGSTVQLGVRLHKGKLHLDYSDRSSKRPKTASTKLLEVFDEEWHTVILSVTGRRLEVKLDCGKSKTSKLSRVYPALLELSHSNLHVANCNAAKDQFSGLLNQLLILPGADVSVLTCPSTTPTLPDISILPGVGPDYPTVSIPPSVAQNSVCTWRDTGKLWFDFHHKQLKVCFSGIWQSVITQPAPEPEKPEITRPKRMDYIMWHQDLITSAPTIDLEVFEIEGEGLFLALASYSDSADDLKKQQSAIFKWEEGRFVMYQSLYTLGAQGWEFFTIGKQSYLAVANHGMSRSKPSKSIIYRWNRKRKRFTAYQELVTWTARDIEYFAIDGSHYLAVANHVKGQNHSIDSVIYRWDGRQKQFDVYQTIVTLGAYDWTFFTVEGYHFLMVANSFSGPPIRSTRINSVIYLWQAKGSKGHFVEFQTIETYGATDWEHFKLGRDDFLVVSNALDFGPHTTADTARSYQTNSTIYRLNKMHQQFEIYQNLTTHSAVDWEFFTVGSDHYLVVSNAQQGLAETPNNVIYRWQGVEKFVPVHSIETYPSADWEAFTVDGEQYLVYCNADDQVSQVFKIKCIDS